MIYPAVISGHVDRHRRRAGRLRAAAVQDLLREPARQAAAADPDAARRHRLPDDLVVGARSAAQLAVGLGISRALRTDRRPARSATASLLRMPVVGETIQYALVERFCRILASMVGAGVPLPEALRGRDRLAAQPGVHARPGDGRRRDARGRGSGAPAGRHQAVPADRERRCCASARRPARLDTQLEVTAAVLRDASSTTRSSKLTALFEPAVILVMGLLVGFVAVALVSAMYGIFNQVKT